MGEELQQEGSKKRKRTGKQREEAKKAAIQAKLAAEASQPAVDDETKAEPEDEAVADEQQPTVAAVDFDKIASRIPQALKTLHPTFKQSKSFEVRRLVKKTKFLRTKEGSTEELADLEAQLAMISHIALDPIIQSHLRLKLAKHPLLKSSTIPADIIARLTPSDTPSTSQAEKLRMKVENRLCSSKRVSEAVKVVVAWTAGEEGAKLVKGKSNRLEPASTSKSGVKSARKIDASDEEDSGEESDDDLVASAGKARTLLKEGADDEDSDDELAQADMRADEAGWESGSISDVDNYDVAGRLAPASSDEEDEGSDSSALSAPKYSKKTKTSQPAKQPKQPKSAKGKNEPVTSSTFLPSLSHGFVMGDSDSDPDLDPDVDGAGIVGRKGAERKNRRGQRARQAIWEKKYGKNAKHVVKAREEEKVKEREKKFGPSDKGWARKSETAPGGNAPASTQGGATASKVIPRADRPSMLSQAPASNPAATAAAADKALHPSWEAARLRKQKEMAAAPKAQKIVFD